MIGKVRAIEPFDFAQGRLSIAWMQKRIVAKGRAVP